MAVNKENLIEHFEDQISRKIMNKRKIKPPSSLKSSSCFHQRFMPRNQKEEHSLHENYLANATA